MQRTPRCPPGGTTCPKAGIKIHESNNDYKVDPFLVDLNLDNYLLEDLFRLFGITSVTLTDDIMREAKKKVLMTHPDKSKQDPKYFLFFSNAYKRLFSIYEFQNKSIDNKKVKHEEYRDDDKQHIVDRLMDQKTGMSRGQFNSWFNEQFEKNRVENTLETGYGDWLKSDEGVFSENIKVTKNNMNEIFEQQKKQVQALTQYRGVNDMFSSTSVGGTLLGADSVENYGSSNLFGSFGYSDLRQAHVESVIPVTMDDYNNMPKYRNVNDYKSSRDRVDTTPLSEAESRNILYNRDRQMEEQSAALAYHYAKQSEKALNASKNVWSDLLKLTNK